MGRFFLEKKMKKVLFVTGTRADFGKIEPLAMAIKNSNFRVGFFITGMHMLKRYGLTKIEIEKITNVDRMEFLNQRDNDSQDMVLSKTITGFSDYVREYSPDLVVIHGDRVEAIAAALVCVINNIRSVHIEGGEVSGNVDELYRHCNTKLCSSHFVSSKVAKERVIKMGENPNRVFILGSPELDVHLESSNLPLDQVKKYYEIDWNDFGIIIFHSVTSDRETIQSQAKAFYSTLVDSNKKFVVILPNNDPGSEMIFDVISTLPSNKFKIIPSMKFSYFSKLLQSSSALLGNSSAGVREAPFLGIPSLDIGNRQTNRSDADSITWSDAKNKEKISNFLNEEWGKKYKRDNSFGEGNSSQKFHDILNDSLLWSLSVQKHFHEKK